MEIIKLLIKEHEQIEQELDELEEVIDEMIKEGVINFPNLIHSLKRIKELWDKHEAKEEQVFPIFRKERIVISVRTILFEHGELRKLFDKIMKAITLSDHLKITLKKEGKAIINKLREHKRKEEEMLLTISKEELTSSEIVELERLAKELY